MEEIIKSKWEFLLQCKPEIRSIIGNTKLIGGHIGHNSMHRSILSDIGFSAEAMTYGRTYSRVTY